jgi:hypothetical protein
LDLRSLIDLGGFLGKGQDTRNKSSSYRKGQGPYCKITGSSTSFRPACTGASASFKSPAVRAMGGSVDSCKGRRRSSRILGVLSAHGDEGRRPDSAGRRRRARPPGAAQAGWRRGQEKSRARRAAPGAALYRGAGAGALGSHAQATATAMAGFGRWALAGLAAGPARAGRSGSGLRARPVPGG